MFFQGGGFSSTSAWTDEEYQAYVQKMQEEREARIKRMYEAQELVDSIDDPVKKLEAQRQRYKCGEDYLTVDEIPKWSDLSTDLLAKQKQKEGETSTSENNNNNNNNERASFMSFFSRRPALTFDPVDKMTRYPVDDSINSKIALIRGDITTLEVDGIVNAANSSLMGGGGVDGAIHSAAGPLLENECRQLNGAETGETKITKGYALPAKYILHTVGPIERGDRQLRACYRSSLDLCIKHNLKTVAFCCISTGIYGFPLKRATHIALDEARKFLNSLKNGTYESGPLAENNVGPRSRRGNKDKEEEEPKTIIDDNDDDNKKEEQENVNENNQQKQQQPGLNAIDKIIFCVFTAEELQSYENLLPTYFPIEGFYAEKYDPSEIDPAKLDDFNRDDARVWNSGGGMMMGNAGGGSTSDDKGQNGISFV